MNIVLAKEIESSIKESIVDGEGLRLVIFFCGCNLGCPNCHNKKYWSIDAGVSYSIIDIYNHIIEKLKKGYYDGVTFSGGDPFFQYDGLKELMKMLKNTLPDLNIWVYTGNIYEDIKDKSIFKYINVLVDGPFIESKKGFFRFRGSENQRILYIK